MGTAFHRPVMVDEVTKILAEAPIATPDTQQGGPASGNYVVDATAGGAGHAMALLAARSDFNLLGIDRDPAAVTAARCRLAEFGERARIVQGRFGELEQILEAELPDGSALVGALWDFGVSSHQLDTAERGFSYRLDGPLNMAMDPNSGLTADTVVNTYSLEQLTKVLRDNADERFARRIATAIVSARPLRTTTELADVVKTAIPAATRRGGRHPAMRSFSAIRMEVNDELAEIQPSLRAALGRLVPGGRMVTLTYHSKEDRMVKLEFQAAADGVCFCPMALPCICGAEPCVKLIARGSAPSAHETAQNRRAASARLRAAQRLPYATS